MPTDPDLSLLLPEWQGYGVDTTVADGARELAALLGIDDFVEVAPPDVGPLAVEEGVLGLSAIVPYLDDVLSTIRERQPQRIFTVGGTCGVELAPVSYLNERYHGDLGVVWFDAHGDANTPQTSPSARFHGMVLRTLLGAGPASLVSRLPRRLSAEQVVLAGTRDLDRDEATFVSDSAMSYLSPADLLVPDRVTGRIRTGGYTRLYLHLDLDVLDPQAFPYALVPTPGGVSIDALVEVVRALVAAFDIVGFSVVEFHPKAVDAVSRVAYLFDRFGIDIGALARRVR